MRLLYVVFTSDVCADNDVVTTLYLKSHFGMDVSLQIPPISSDQLHFRTLVYDLSRPCSFNFFKGCFPQVLLGPFLSTLSNGCQRPLQKSPLKKLRGESRTHAAFRMESLTHLFLMQPFSTP